MSDGKSVLNMADGEPVEASSAPEAGDGAKGPAAMELERLRRRAERAEAQASELDAQVGALKDELNQSRNALDAADQRRRIDAALVEAEAIDLETARLLTETTLSAMDDTDVEAAVGELRRTKPFLFRRGGAAAAGGATAMSPTPDGGLDGGAERAAEEAMRTGDRRALLRYLRARRKE